MPFLPRESEPKATKKQAPIKGRCLFYIAYSHINLMTFAKVRILFNPATAVRKKKENSDLAPYHIMSLAACWARALWAAFILPKFHLTPNRI